MSASRRMRRNLSLPEQLLWRLLRSTRGHLRFRRQHAIGPFVADFYCPAVKLVIEIDGALHDQRQAKDARRDAYLENLGLRVIRIGAAEVLSDPEGTADSLVRLAKAYAGPSITQPMG